MPDICVFWQCKSKPEKNRTVDKLYYSSNIDLIGFNSNLDDFRGCCSAGLTSAQLSQQRSESGGRLIRAGAGRDDLTTLRLQMMSPTMPPICPRLCTLKRRAEDGCCLLSAAGGCGVRGGGHQEWLRARCPPPQNTR